MADIASLATAQSQIQLQQQVGIKVVGKALDHAREQGTAINALIQDVANMQEKLAAAEMGVGRNLDTFA
ncbi:MAG: putative motility protein [Phycisphaeraceae bacterium]